MANKSGDFNLFEQKLQAALRPVQPSMKYVQTIRKRIHFKSPVVVSQRFKQAPPMLLVLGGVLSVSLLIITFARALFYVSNRSKI